MLDWELGWALAMFISPAQVRVNFQIVSRSGTKLKGLTLAFLRLTKRWNFVEAYCSTLKYFILDNFYLGQCEQAKIFTKYRNEVKYKMSRILLIL